MSKMMSKMPVMLCAVNECQMIYAVNTKNKIKTAQHGGVHPKAQSACPRLMRRGSCSQLSPGTRGAVEGARGPKGTVMTGLPGPISEG